MPPGPSARWAGAAAWAGCLAVASAEAAPAAAAVVSGGDADMVAACMLLGSVAFVMSMFYVLNHEDGDIKRYSWEVVSRSICTFVGVLIGLSCNSFLASAIGPSPSFLMMEVVQALSVLGWHLVLSLTLAYVSGAVGDSPPKTVEGMILNMKCFAVLLGMVTGASQMVLWGMIQQSIPRTIFATALVVPAAALILKALFAVAQAWREWIWLSDDGSKDVYEEVWDKYTLQTEDGAASLCLAHLVVQVCRFHVCGELPLAGGQLAAGYKPGPFEAAAMAALAIVFAAFLPVTSLAVPEALGRQKQWLKGIAGNSMAFCMLYSINWAIGDALGLSGPRGAMVLALVVTLFAFALIFLLDHVHDTSWTGDMVDKEIRSLVVPIAVFIGFAWKQAFVAAFTTIVQRESSILGAPVERMILALVLASVVVPAWRWYILPVVMAAELQQAREAPKQRATYAGRSRSAPSRREYRALRPLEDPEGALEMASRPDTDEVPSCGFEDLDLVRVTPEGLEITHLGGKAPPFGVPVLLR